MRCGRLGSWRSNRNGRREIVNRGLAGDCESITPPRLAPKTGARTWGTGHMSTARVVRKYPWRSSGESSSKWLWNLCSTRWIPWHKSILVDCLGPGTLVGRALNRCVRCWCVLTEIAAHRLLTFCFKLFRCTNLISHCYPLSNNQQRGCLFLSTSKVH